MLAISNGDVILIIALAAIPVAAIVFVLGAGTALKQIGKGQFAIEQELPQKQGGGSMSGAGSGEVREAEIRQMVEAKAYRREQRGGEPIDVEAEVRRLMDDAPAPVAWPGRRASHGGPPARRRAQRAPPAQGPGAARRRVRGRAPAARAREPRAVITY